MNSIKRYDFVKYGEHYNGLSENKDGKLVMWSDYAALEAHAKELEKAIEETDKILKKLRVDFL